MGFLRPARPLVARAHRLQKPLPRPLPVPPRLRLPPPHLPLRYALIRRYNVPAREPAHQPVDETPDRAVVSWTATISSIGSCARSGCAARTFRSMLRRGVSPNYVTVLCTARALTAAGVAQLPASLLHALAVKFRFLSEPPVSTALLGLYSFQGGIDAARQLFLEAPTRDLVAWSAMISALSKRGMHTEALDAFCEMQLPESGSLVPNDVSVIAALPACGYLGDALLGKQIHAFAIKRDIYSKTSVQNSIVDLYAKLGILDSSVRVFERIEQKDAISWKTIICGLKDAQAPKEALVFFSRMGSSGIAPSEIIIRNVLVASSQAEDLDFTLSLHGYIVKSRAFSRSTSVSTSLLRAYAAVGKVDSASCLFEMLEHKDLIAWSAMVSVYAQGDRPHLALEMYRQMASAKVVANEVTLVSLLRACICLGAQREGRSLHAHVIRFEYPANTHIASALIDFYCKLGLLRQGEALFSGLGNKDVVCWSSIIHGYGTNGCGEQAVGAFLDMLQQGIRPNEIAFVSLLSACSHNGLVDEGYKWFNSMEEDHGVHPTLAHYSCIVDGLSRQGRIEEALNFIREMPMKPDRTTWGALLAGCRVRHEDAKAAEIAATELSRLDPTNGSYYVALSNLYAELGKWSDVERIRDLVQENSLGKTVGISIS